MKTFSPYDVSNNEISKPGIPRYAQTMLHCYYFQNTFIRKLNIIIANIASYFEFKHNRDICKSKTVPACIRHCFKSKIEITIDLFSF